MTMPPACLRVGPLTRRRLLAAAPALAACASVAHADPPLQTVRAPMTLDADGRGVVDVLLNGQGPFRLIVDTGATATVLAPEPAAALGLVPTHEATLIGIAGVTQAPMAPLQSLAIAGAEWPNVDVAVLGGRVLSGADGLLGMGLWRRQRVTLDFEERELRIGPSAGRSVRRGLLRAPGHTLQDTLFLTSIRAGRLQALAMVDTGATHTLVNPALAEALIPLATPGQDVRAATASATAALQPVALPVLAIGGLRVRRLNGFTASLDVFDLWAEPHQPALVLGMDVWRRTQALSLDYALSELQLRLEIAPAITRMEATRLPD